MIKKCLFGLGLCFLVGCMMSCTPSVESVVKKIDAKESLTDADYKVMCSYVKDCLTEVKEILEKGDQSTKSEEIATVSKKYPYIAKFTMELDKNPDKIDNETAEAMEIF